MPATEPVRPAAPLRVAPQNLEAEQALLALHPGDDGPRDRAAWVTLMLRNARGHQPTQAEQGRTVVAPVIHFVFEPF